MECMRVLLLPPPRCGILSRPQMTVAQSRLVTRPYAQISAFLSERAEPAVVREKRRSALAVVDSEQA